MHTLRQHSLHDKRETVEGKIEMLLDIKLSQLPFFLAKHGLHDLRVLLNTEGLFRGKLKLEPNSKSISLLHF